MASASAAATKQKPRSFAGLLEQYAAPAAKFPPARDLDGLEDDVATLTCEHILRGRGRYRREPDPPVLEPQPSHPAPAISQPSPDLRKSASITLRLTAAEDDQLRDRATEAGMSVSAYLRSCAFEVETLRAQVKEALARMKQPDGDLAPPKIPAQPKTPWIRRLFARTKNSA